MRVYDYLLDAGRDKPEQIALEFKGMKFPYKLVAEEARKAGAGMQSLGIKPRDAVGIMLPNIPQFVSTLFGAFMAGARVVPFNVLLRASEIRYLIEDSDIRLIVAWEGFLAQIDEALAGLENPPIIVLLGKGGHDHLPFSKLLGDSANFTPVESGPEDAVLTVYTSGTTGKPKGALLTNANIIANMRMSEEVFTPQPGDKSLCVLPLFHVYALNALLIAGIKNATTNVLHPRFEIEDVIHSLKNDDITTFAGVPTMYFYILKHPAAQGVKFPKLRHCFSGGAAMPVDVMRQFEEAFGVTIYEGYGLTETTVSICCNHPGMPRKPGSIGKPFKPVQMKIVDEAGNELPDGEKGEIIVKSPNVMKGYHNKPEATAEAIRDGWFHTGDVGYRDSDGYFFIVDRIKDMIIKGGYNIYPREIEEVIYQFPQVAEAAVVGVYDEAKGEQVRAVVALKPGQELSWAEIEAHLEANLAKYKLPHDIVFVPELPKGPTGKILKREIIKSLPQWNKDRVAGKA